MHRRMIRSVLVATLAFAVLGGPSAAQAQDATNNTGVGPFTKANYPADEIDRPLTLPAGMVEVAFDLVYFKIDLGALGGGSQTSAAFSASYGVGDKIEVGVGTSLGIDPDFDWGKNLALRVGYLAHDSKNLDVRPGVSTSLSFADGADLFSGFNLDAFTRFKLNNMIAITGGQNLVSVRTSDPSRVNVNVVVGVLAQLLPKLAVSVDTQLVSLAVSGDGNETTSLGDFIPVNLRVQYTAAPKLDIGLFASFPSIEDAGDLYIVGFGAAYRL